MRGLYLGTVLEKILIFCAVQLVVKKRLRLRINEMTSVLRKKTGDNFGYFDQVGIDATYSDLGAR